MLEIAIEHCVQMELVGEYEVRVGGNLVLKGVYCQLPVGVIELPMSQCYWRRRRVNFQVGVTRPDGLCLQRAAGETPPLSPPQY